MLSHANLSWVECIHEPHIKKTGWLRYPQDFTLTSNPETKKYSSTISIRRVSLCHSARKKRETIHHRAGEGAEKCCWTLLLHCENEQIGWIMQCGPQRSQPPPPCSSVGSHDGLGSQLSAVRSSTHPRPSTPKHFPPKTTTTTTPLLPKPLNSQDNKNGPRGHSERANRYPDICRVGLGLLLSNSWWCEAQTSFHCHRPWKVTAEPFWIRTWAHRFHTAITGCRASGVDLGA